MLLRRTGPDVIAIPQPSHSWLSGQMARAWGNDRFARPAPNAEFCLAAEQHDLGWLTWELAPQIDPDTGLPREFMRVAPETHVALWTDGVRRAHVYGTYTALLVSFHAETIYSRHFDFAKASPENKRIVHAFLDDQRAFRHALVADLRAARQLTDVSSEDAVERNRLVLAALDWMSLQICWGVGKEVRLADVPTAGTERIELALRLDGEATNRIIVDPWPFDQAELEVRAEGRRLHDRFDNEDAMRAALGRAEPALIVSTLVPA